MTYEIHKIKAAERQLDTAVKLFWSNSCDVSYCVLVHGAWSLIKDICKRKNVETSRDWMLGLFSNHEPNEIWKSLDRNWNSFKHARNEHDDVVQFDSSYLEAALMLAINDFAVVYSKLEFHNKGKISNSLELYQLWFIAKNPNLFQGQAIVEEVKKVFPDLTQKSEVEQKLVALNELENFVEDI